MSLKAQLEAIIYAAETPITLEQMTQLVKETVIAEGAADEAEMKSRVRSALESQKLLVEAYESARARDSIGGASSIKRASSGVRSSKTTFCASCSGSW